MESYFDDERLIDAEFFQRSLMIGDSANGRDQKRFEIRPGVRVLGYACAGPKCWEYELWVGNQCVCSNPTYGHIRRLCRELWVGLIDLPMLPQAKAPAVEEPKENPELPKPEKNEPDIPAIFSVIADLATSTGLGIEEVIDQVNSARGLDPLTAAEIKLKIVEHWRTVASFYPFMRPSEREIERLKNELRRLELRRDAVAAVAPFFR